MIHSRTLGNLGGMRFGDKLWQPLGVLIRTTSWRFVGVLTLMLCINFTEGVSLLMLVPMLQVVGLDVGQGSVGQIAEVMRRGFVAIGLQPTVASVIVLYVLVVSARALLSSWQFSAIARLDQDCIVQMRQQLYGAITKANWLFFTRNRGSTFTHALTDEVSRAGSAVHALLFLIAQIITALVYFILALLLSPAMTSLVLACGAVLLLALMGKTRLARDRGEGVSLAHKGMYDAIGEHLAGMKTSKSHGREDHHTSVFARMTEQVATMHVSVVKNYVDVNFWFNVGSTIILGFLLFAALELLALPTVAILLLFFLFARLIPMFSGIQHQYQSFASMVPAFDNVMELQARCEAAAEPQAQTAVNFRLRRGIHLEGVSFSYRSEDAGPTLHNLNLIIEAGKTTAIVGPSGAGKSTIADLVVGLIAPDQGQVLVDGEILGPERIRAWREQIGYVAQDTFFFHDSVRENLLSTCLGASNEDITEALELAAADEIIARLPQGLETVVGDRGVLLSGGERQRLALTRALLRKPSLLILDEATSSLDSENEARIIKAIERLHGSVTTMVISHRLSTVRKADMIYVLEHGHIVESGTWQTLTEKVQGRFAALCRAQGVLQEGKS